MSAKRQFTEREKATIAALTVSTFRSTQEYFGMAALSGIDVDPAQLEEMHGLMVRVFEVWPHLLEAGNPAGELFKSADPDAHSRALQGASDPG